MVSISATLTLMDNFSNRLNGIDKSLAGAGSKMDKFKKSVEAPISSSAFNGAGKSIDDFGSRGIQATDMLKSGLDRADSALTSIAKTAASVAFTGLKIGGAALAGGLIASVKSAGDLEQSVGGVNKLFGDIASQDVMANARNAFKTAGRSMNEYLETATSYAPKLLSDLGGNAAAAAAQVDKAMVQMSDNSNTFGTQLGSLQDAYNGFAKGNYTMLDNLKLGYGGTGEEMMKLIKDAGVVERGFKSMDEISFSEIIDSVQVIQDRLKVTGTTAKEAATTLNGSFIMAKKSFANFLATGENVDQVVDSFLQFGSIAFKMANEMAPKLWAGIKTAFERVKPQIPGLLADTFGTVATTIGNMFGINIDPKIFDVIRNMSFENVAKTAQRAAKAILGVVVAVKGLRLATTIMSKFGVIGGGGGGSKNPFAKKGAFVADIKKSAAGFIKNAGNLALIYGAVKVFEEVIKAVKKLEGIPPVGDISPQLISVGIAVASVGGAMVLVGLALNKIKGAKKTLALGAIALLAISYTMKDIAKSMKAINDNVPTDIASVATKMLNIGIAVGSISLLAGVLGALVSTGIGAIIAGAGLTTLELVAHSMSSLAGAIGRINAEVPADISGVEGKINTLVHAVESITNSGLGNALAVIKSVFAAVETTAADVAIGALIAISNKLITLNAIQVPDDSQAKITKIVGAIKSITDSGLGRLLDTIKTVFGVAQAKAADVAIDSLISISRKLQELNKIGKIPDVTGKLKILDKNIAQIQNASTTFGSVNAGNAENALAAIKSIMKMLPKFQVLADKDVKDVRASLKIIDQNLEKLQDTTTFAGSMNASALLIASTALDNIMTLITKFDRLGAFTPKYVVDKLTTLDLNIEKLQDTTTFNGSMNSEALLTASTAIDNIMTLIPKFDRLAAFVVQDIREKLILIDNILEKVQNTTTFAGSMNANEVLTAGIAIDNIKVIIDKMNELSAKLSGFVAPDLTSLKTAISSLSGLGGGGGVASLANAIADLIPKLSNLSTALNTMTTTTVSGMTAIENSSKQGMANFATSVKTGGTQAVSAMVSTMAQIRSVAQSGSSSMVGIGAQIGNGLAVGMRSALGAITAAADEMVAQAEKAAQAKAKIHSPSRLFRDGVGKFLGLGVAVGMDKQSGIVAASSASLISNALNAAKDAVPQIGLGVGLKSEGGTPQVGLDRTAVFGSGDTGNASNEVTNSENSSLIINFDEGAIQITPSGDTDVDAKGLFDKFNKYIADQYNKNLRYV